MFPQWFSELNRQDPQSASVKQTMSESIFAPANWGKVTQLVSPQGWKQKLGATLCSPVLTTRHSPGSKALLNPCSSHSCRVPGQDTDLPFCLWVTPCRAFGNKIHMEEQKGSSTIHGTDITCRKVSPNSCTNPSDTQTNKRAMTATTTQPHTNPRQT